MNGNSEIGTTISLSFTMRNDRSAEWPLSSVECAFDSLSDYYTGINNAADQVMSAPVASAGPGDTTIYTCSALMVASVEINTGSIPKLTFTSVNPAQVFQFYFPSLRFFPI